jgi:hypothetical protein
LAFDIFKYPSTFILGLALYLGDPFYISQWR